MNYKRAPILFVFIISFSSLSFSQTLLNITYGSRSIAMGNTGYALADDEVGTFYNPAGLGLLNSKWNGGSISCFVEQLESNLINSFYSSTYQNECFDRLGFGSYLCLFFLGNEDRTDVLGNVLDKEKYYQYSFSQSVGFRFYSNRYIDNSVGLSIKFLQSYNEYVNSGLKISANTIVGDLGYILQIVNRIRLGVSLRNIGNDVKWQYNDTISNYSKLPFNINIGIGYKDSFCFRNIRFIDIASEISYRELFNQPPINGSATNYEVLAGLDMCFLNSISTRIGYSYYSDISFNNISWGIGISALNHFNLDFFYSINNNDVLKFAEHYGFSFSLTRAFKWNKSDLKWWLK